MSEELEVLKDVTRRLDRAGLSYMITGSMAATFYTVPRMTRDIDIVVELAEADLGSFIPLFEADFYLDPQTVRDAVKHQGMFKLIQNEYVVKIDFIVRKDSPYRPREFSRRRKVGVDGQSFYLVAPERSHTLQTRMGQGFAIGNTVIRREKSVELGQAAQPRRYLTRWSKELGIEALYREVCR